VPETLGDICIIIIIITWFVRLLALWPLLAYCASEDDCREADGM
jgi:hypothetical protein